MRPNSSNGEFAVVAALGGFAKRVGNCQRVDGERFATGGAGRAEKKVPPFTFLSLNYYPST